MTTQTAPQHASARTTIGKTLVELGETNPRLWVLTPDIGHTLMDFRTRFPDRFVDVGLAEQACVSLAAGLAYDGAVSVVSGMLPFLSMRALEQVRTDVCYPNLPVKIIGTHGGLVANGGSTHYAMEDLALMSALTNMTVLSVGDPLFLGDVLKAAVDLPGPAYIRLGAGRSDPVIYEPGTQHCRIGEGIVVRDGDDVTLFTHGTTLPQALAAAQQLAAEGIEARVVDMFTIKPLDEELVLRCARETGGRFVVVEDHLAYGGLASRIADVVVDRGVRLTAFERLGIPQVYAGFGLDEELRDKHGYGLDATITAARRVATGRTDPS